MAYFLKQTKKQNGTYLQIYFSGYDPEMSGSREHCIKSIGCVHKLIALGIPDPISFFEKEVEKMNAEFHQKNAEKTLPDGPRIIRIGCFPVQSIYRQLGLPSFLGSLQAERNFSFSLPDLFESLICSLSLADEEEGDTLENVITALPKKVSFTKQEIRQGISFLGSQHEKITEFLTEQTRRVYNFKKEGCTCGCRSFYMADGSQTPTLNLGLLFDGSGVPAGMKIVMTRELDSEPVMDELEQQKKQLHLQGNTMLPCKEANKEAVRLFEQAFYADDEFLQNRERFTGWLMASYALMLMEKILQTRVLINKFSLQEIQDFMRDLQAIKESDGVWINLASSSPLITEMERRFSLPVNQSRITESEMKRVLNCSLDAAD